MNAPVQPAVEITEVRVLEGPNLYFPRPAGKIALELPGYFEADTEVLQRIGSQLSLRRRSAGEPGSAERRQYVVSLVERLVRLLALEVGTARLGVRTRPVAEHGIVVAFVLRYRGRVQALADALAITLPAMLDGTPAKSAIASAVTALADAPRGETLRPLRPKVPIVAVTGTNGKTTTTRLIAHLAMTAGLRCGWSSTDGVLVQGEVVEPGDYSGPAGARTALQDKTVEFAVLETARGGMLLKGLGTAYNDVSVVTNVSADHLGQNGIDTVDQLAEVKAIITKVTKPTGWVVLNGDDPRVWAMRSTASAPVWCFSLDPESPSLRESREAGGRGITVIDGEIVVLMPHQPPQTLVSVLDVPMTICGLSLHNLANALAGAAAGLASGLPTESVVEGLRTFAPDAAHNAGRMNMYSLPLADGGNVTVILDMAHNEGGLEALLRVARGLCEPGSNVVLGLGTGGDRTDDILRNLGEMAGLDADRVHIQHKAKYLRERSMEDLEAKFVEGLTRVGATAVSSSPTELDGLQALIADAHDGDVLPLMTHADRALLHDWLLQQGATEDDEETVRRKAIRARGEHEAEDRITALWEMDDAQERIHEATRLRAEFPSDARVLYEYAGTFDSAGDEEPAVEAYDEALAAGLREPFRRRALIQKASTLRHLGRYEESLQILDDLRAAWPDNDAIAIFRALTLNDMGEHAVAAGDLARFLVAQSTHGDIERYRRSLTRFTDELG
ncbi:tetratricopeptide repeat protein [Yimella sp. cx-51]|uniref:tetratricopeptide repeat protein n=1 Tax=Yimella sp. cx-51 TaxID=2770551 RepID=UPI00165D82BE|nr:tetratricopeptide repeat protein [Yimella sp. cx-51]MBC9957397.1 tetratricopeptide repeat protein [Yimella sp. cx-51]QTH39363.1 tetratricopeptide repeat protein [Yimella sp. cx-51]